MKYILKKERERARIESLDQRRVDNIMQPDIGEKKLIEVNNIDLNRADLDLGNR